MNLHDGQIGRVIGPGSVTVPVFISLENLQRRLIEASHPVGDLPQWRGDSVFLVMLSQGERIRASVISANTQEKAETVAIKTAEGHGWKLVGCQKIRFDGNGNHATIENLPTETASAAPAV